MTKYAEPQSPSNRTAPVDDDHADDIVYPLHRPFSPGSSGLLRRDLDRGHGGGAGPLRRLLYSADVRDRGGLPSLLRPPRLQDQPGRSVPARLPGPDLGPAWGAVVGGQAPPAPQPRGHRARRALAAPARLPPCAPRLDLHATAWRHRLRSDRRFRAISGAGVARSAPLPAGRPARPADVADRRLAGPRGRLLLEHRAGLAWPPSPSTRWLTSQGAGAT